jgi:hypothetical protein
MYKTSAGCFHNKKSGVPLKQTIDTNIIVLKTKFPGSQNYTHKYIKNIDPDVEMYTIEFDIPEKLAIEHGWMTKNE